MREKNNVTGKLAISKYHRNRRRHNWLIYDVGDKFLLKHSRRFRGALYDLGCGEAPYREFFLGFADRYVGVDWAVSIHDTKADIIADLNQPLPIDSGVADTVVSLSAMEHLCEPQVMLNEAFRILRPGGSIVLQVPWQWWIHEAPHDFFRYSPYGLHHMFSKAGFVNIMVEPQAGFFTTAVLKWNYFSSRFLRGPLLARRCMQVGLFPMWYFGQLLAPALDKLDHNWALEAPGYYVTAIKK